MTGLTYTTYVNQIATLAVVPVTDPNFISIIPSMIDYAELRMQRDIDFLNTSAQLPFTSVGGSFEVNLTPDYPFVVIENVGYNDPVTGYTIQLTPTTKEFIYAVYPVGCDSGTPQYFAPFNDNLLLVAPPPPNTGNNFVVTGTQRFPSLSALNPTTFISTYLPDVFIMASMVYVSSYQRNFGKVNDDPQMAITYESQYQTLLKGAATEEARKKFEASGWTSQAPTTVATPTR